MRYIKGVPHLAVPVNPMSVAASAETLHVSIGFIQ